MCNTQKPHKHAEVIKAWADGAIIQFRPQGTKWAWENCCNNNPNWLNNYEYRVKPQTQKYRVGLFRINESHKTTCLFQQEASAQEAEKYHNFIKWLTDWIEYEV